MGAYVDVMLGLPGAPSVDRVFDPTGDILGSCRLGAAALEGDPSHRKAGALTLGKLERGAQRRVLDGDLRAGADRDLVGSPEGPPTVLGAPEEGLHQPILGARHELHRDL